MLGAVAVTVHGLVPIAGDRSGPEVRREPRRVFELVLTRRGFEGGAANAECPRVDSADVSWRSFPSSSNGSANTGSSLSVIFRVS